MKKSIAILIIISTVLLSACSVTGMDNNNKIKIVTTIFPLYDFARQMAKDSDNVTVTMLLPPGGDSHTYSPTPKDILTIENCDLFIYIGGESDTWIENILNSLKNDIKTLKFFDHVELLHEIHDHGDEEHEEVDEHIWTSLRNASDIVTLIASELAAFDVENDSLYMKNKIDYINELNILDEKFVELFNENTKTFVFGDKFPFRYFERDYGIKYYAAYPSCNTESDPSAATIAALSDIVVAENIDTVFHIEFSSKQIAETIAAASDNCGIALWHSGHNVSAEELKNGITYLQLMKQNYDVIANYIQN